MAIFGKKQSGGLGREVVDKAPLVLGGDRLISEGQVLPPAEANDGNLPSFKLDASASEASAIVDDLTSAAPKKKGFWGRSKNKAAPAPEPKEAVAEAPKKPSEKTKVDRKTRQAEALAAQSELDSRRISIQVMIDFLPGVTKEDAVEWAKRWAHTHMAVPSDCYYHVQKYGEGFAVEVQEGVGKAYLPSVLELAQKNPGRPILVPMARRVLSIVYSQRTGDFDSQVMPEGQRPPSDQSPLEASRGPDMVALMKQHVNWLIGGAAVAGMGFLFLMSSLVFLAVDDKVKLPPDWRTTDVEKLPIMQWSRLQADATDSYVVRFEFHDNRWQIIRQAVGASSQSVETGEGASQGIIGGTNVAPPSENGPIAMPAGETTIQRPIGPPPASTSNPTARAIR